MKNEIPYARKLFSTALDTINLVIENEAQNISEAAQKISKSISEGGIVHIFGAGHSHLFAEDISFRAGGLVPINPIVDVDYTFMGGPPSFSSRLERLDGFANALLENYEFYPGEVFIIMSQSGRNPGPVEAALYAKSKDLQVIAVTSVQQSKEQLSRHSSGKNLYEIADLVIDNHVPKGDAAVELEKGLPKVAPISTIVGASILQAIVAEVAGLIRDSGEYPPVWVSSNIEGGDEHNDKMAAKYKSRKKSF
jgi:uncharacterized phosphosugar-binding protein